MFIKQHRNELLTSCRESTANVAKFFCLPGVNTHTHTHIFTYQGNDSRNNQSSKWFSSWLFD